jgi:flagella synthesis protein FlgN
MQQCLEQEIQAMNLLTNLLQQEQAVLVEGRVEDLQPITLQKNQMVADVSVLETVRNRHLGSLGFSGDAAGMQAYLQRQPSDGSVNRSWSELRSIAESAKECNRTNGILINKQINFTQSALGILQQGQGDATGSFYGPNGQSTVGKFSGRGFAAR